MTTDEILVRRAMPEDRSQIVNLSSQIWDDDYLPKVVDEWLAEEAGEFSVALLNDEVVGFSKLSELGPGHGWLQGARVSPAFQGRGVGRALTRHHIDLARARGIHTLRMATDSDNTASRTLAAKMGFFLAGEFVRYRSEPLPAAEALDVPAVPPFHGLPPVPATGLIPAGWTFYPWNEDMLSNWAREGKLYGNEQAGMAMMQGNRPERINILMLWGPPEEAGSLLTFARRQPQGVELINCVISEEKYYRVLEQTGYHNLDKHTLVVYQYNLCS